MNQYILFLAATELRECICEGRSKVFRCPAGRVLQITYANYGRINRDDCKSRSIRTTNCKSTRTMAIVMARCNSKGFCSLAASNVFFRHDPCRGTYKYLEIKYTCRGPNPSKPSGRARKYTLLDVS